MKKNLFAKVLSCTMALLMVFGVCTPVMTMAASDPTGSAGTVGEVINYVSLGDSMTNGYGFVGYEQGTDKPTFDNPDYDFRSGKGVYGNGSYALQFEEYLKQGGNTVNHTKLAPSAMRAEDLLYLLGGREKPTDGWYDEVNNYTGIYDDAVLSEHFINAVTEADIMTLCIGNASFGAYLVQAVTRALGVMGGSLPDEEKVNLADALAIVESEEIKEIVLDIYATFEAELQPYMSVVPFEAEQMEDILGILTYTAASFLVNYEALIDKILELNPDAKIILIGLMNTTYGMTITGEGFEPFPFGDIMDKIFGMLNAYIAGVPATKQALGQYADATFYYAEQPAPKFIVQVFDELAEAGWGKIDKDRLSGAIVRERQLEAYNKNLREMIGNALGFELPEITLSDLDTYVIGEAPIISFPGETYESYDSYGDYAIIGTPTKKHIDTYISVAIYRAIEEAVVASVDTMEITVDGLLGIAGNNIFDALGDIPTEIKPENSPGPWTIKTELVKWFTGSETGRAMCKVYALFKVGNGMSVHPTPEGHDEIFKAVKAAYEDEYTAQDETIKNALAALELAKELVLEYYDEAYAEAYKYAVANGYIDSASNAIDQAIAAINAIDLSETEMTDAFKEELKAELQAVVVTLTKIKAALVSDQFATVDMMVNSVLALEEDLYIHLDNIKAICEQAGIDVYELVIVPQIEIIKTQTIPMLKETIQTMLDEACRYLANKISEIFGIVIDVKLSVEEMLNKMYEEIVRKIATVIGVVVDFNATVEEIIEAIHDHIDHIRMGEYTVDEDSYYLAITNDAAEAAALVADKIWLSDKFDVVTWADVAAGNVDLTKYDFITVSYDDTCAVDFTAAQMLGVMKAYYVDVMTFIANAENAYNTAYPSANLDISGMLKAEIAKIEGASEIIALIENASVTELDWAALVGAEKASFIDDIRANLTAALVEAGVPTTYTLTVDVAKEVANIAKQYGPISEDDLRNALGEYSTYTLSIPVIDLAVLTAESALYQYVSYNTLYANTINAIDDDVTVAVLGNYNRFDVDYEITVDEVTFTLAELLSTIKLDEVTVPAEVEQFIAEISAIETYEIKVPVADIVDFAMGKYTEVYVQVFGALLNTELPVCNDIKAMIAGLLDTGNAHLNNIAVDLREVGEYTIIIPVADIVEKANEYGYTLADLICVSMNTEITVGGETVVVDDVLDVLSGISSIHPLAYAVMNRNVFYVDISDASIGGAAYIAEQILNALEVTCEHIYDDNCLDSSCNRCNELREVPADHAWYEVSRTHGDCTTFIWVTERCRNCTAGIRTYNLGYGAHSGYRLTGSTTGANCETAGIDTYTCACGRDSYTVANRQYGNHIATAVPGKDASCTETGLTDGTKCSVCETVILPQTEIPAKGHTEEVVPGKEATCTEAGLTEGKKCSVCEAVIVEQTEIEAKGHTEEVVPGKEATCTEAGLTEGKKCSVCEAVIVEQTEIEAKGHTEEVVPGKEATCTEKGMTEGKKCSVCEAVIVEQTEIAAKGHTEVAVPGKEATCTEAGLTEGKKCSVCGTVTVAQTEIAAKGHTEVTVPGKEATCTEAGLTEGKTCSVCGTVTVAQTEFSATGHTEVVVPGTEATCTETGLTEGKNCSVCGEVLTAQQTIAAKGHTEEVIPAVEPTQSEVGYTEGLKCSACGEVLVAPEEVPAKSSAWIWISASSIVVLGGGAAAAYFFIFRKRRIV